MSRSESDVVFRSFDPKAELYCRERNLPHWFQLGAAMFITFRTADSMPGEVIIRWQRQLEAWLTARNLPTALARSTVGQNFSNHDQLLSRLSSSQLHEFKRLSDRAFHRSLDQCHGACLLRQRPFATIVAKAMLFYSDSKYDLDRFAVMPNHVHAIVQFRSGANLKTVSQSWMRYTARKINAAAGNSGTFWQSEPFDHLIRSPEQFEYLQKYIFENPTKANLRSGEFLYWARE